ncbi:TonB-dependent receptor [Erwiniaceae bacterium BAC15a-03b]|uniref:TonB-dependent receptor n=1 Tax=Winslowiella arboricola TaxID=2978220 RepID=A0A9J6PMX9_9GAMM|nr:TonB-dependent receptor [Winslowiella arboricola]MCU5775485.1 TonB-dependent receptor [Winslowiella arboricola]MCU5779665.1 TonB-dependent receptor [Winslowiella arboricola]
MPLLLVFPLQAEAADDNNNEMVVSASRTATEKKDSPQVVTIISKQQIEQQRQLTSDTSQILSNLLPAFSPSRQKMSGSGETFRGRIPLVLVDGIPQSNPLRPTGREMHTIDASMIERIEVIHGANASNGIGASGGVINLITRRPEPGSFNQHFSVEATTPTSQLNSETMSYKTTYAVDGREEYLDYMFAVSYEDQGLFLDGNHKPVGVDNTQGDLMDSRAYDILGKVGYWLDDDQRIQLSVNRYQLKGRNQYLSVTGDREQGIPTGSVKGTPQGEAPFNSVWTTGITYDNYNLAGMKLNALAFYQQYEALFGSTISGSFQDPAIAPVGTLYDQSRAVTSKYGSKMSLTKDDLWDDYLKVTLGFDTLFDSSKQDLWGTHRTYVPEVKYTDLSPFMQLEVAPVESVKLFGGVRYEYARLDIDSYQTIASANSVTVGGGKPSFDKTLYNVGAVWTPVEQLSLFANYSQGFTMPDVGRVLRGINTPGMSVDSFLNLQPIVTNNTEVGFRFQQQPFDLEVSYYKSTSKLGSRVDRVGDMYVTRREKTEIDGIETAVGYAVTENQKLKLGYSHMRGRYDSDDNGSLDAKMDGLNVSPDRIIASWSANWTPQWSTFIQGNWALSRSFDEEDKEFSGYALIDAAVGYTLPRGRLNLAVSNLLDKQYITYYSQSALVEPDRYFAGRGRTLTLGYNVDF